MKFSELINIAQLKELFEQFTTISGLGMALLDYPSQEVIIATGWHDFCTEFHRKGEESSKNCLESDHYLSTKSEQTDEIVINYCKNGLIDGCVALIIDGEHLATIFCGQVLFEKPDIEKFRKQAQVFGFDEEAYIEALKKIPVVTEERLNRHLKYFQTIALFMIEIITSNKKLEKKEQELILLNNNLEKKVEEQTKVSVKLTPRMNRYRLM